jgi:hypothetical protein
MLDFLEGGKLENPAKSLRIKGGKTTKSTYTYVGGSRILGASKPCYTK